MNGYFRYNTEIVWGTGVVVGGLMPLLKNASSNVSSKKKLNIWLTTSKKEMISYIPRDTQKHLEIPGNTQKCPEITDSNKIAENT